MSFGSRLRERREILNLKQIDLGKLIGITGAAIGNYENDVSTPKADILYKLFDALQCDANYLFQDEMKALKTDDFTVPEIRMVRKYRELDEHGKQMVDTTLELEYKRVTEKPKRFVVKRNDYLQVPFAARGGGLQKSNEKRAMHLQKLEEYYKKEGDGET